MKNICLILLFIPLFGFTQREDSLLNFVKRCNFKTLNEKEYKVGDRILAPALQFVIITCSGLENQKTSRDSVQKIVNFIKSHPNLTIEIGFHTDARGSDSSNLILSKRRANTIDEEIKIFYGKYENYMVEGFGEYQPIIPLKYILKNNKRDRKKYYIINSRAELRVIAVNN